MTAPAVVAAAFAVAVTGHPAGVDLGRCQRGAAGLVVGMGRRQSQQRVRQEAELALAQQRAEVEHERAEVLAERNRIAREVHDVLAHTLSALCVQMEALGSLVDDGADPEECVRPLPGRGVWSRRGSRRHGARFGCSATSRSTSSTDRRPGLTTRVTVRIAGRPAAAGASGGAGTREGGPGGRDQRAQARRGRRRDIALAFGDDGSQLTVDNDLGGRPRWRPPVPATGCRACRNGSSSPAAR